MTMIFSWGCLEKNPLLNEVSVNCMEKNQQETELTCVAKRKRYVLVSIR
jgi:hypothetical protein